MWAPARSLAGPGRTECRLRREPLTELDQLASRTKAERTTLAVPNLVGKAGIRGVTVVASDPIVHEPQPQVGVADH